MHIVGTDLCRRLDIDAEMVINEFAILNKARFCFWWMTLLSYFFFVFKDRIPLVAVLPTAFCTYGVFLAF